MFGWGKKRAEDGADVALSETRQMLRQLRMRCRADGPDGTRRLADGVGNVAGLLGERLGISVPAALELRSVPPDRLAEAKEAIGDALDIARRNLDSPSDATREVFGSLAFGQLLFFHLTSLRIAETNVPETRRSEIRGAADDLAAFARVMGEIAVGARQPEDAWSV